MRMPASLKFAVPLLLCLALFSLDASAGTMDSSGLLDDVLNRYNTAASGWAGVVTSAATQVPCHITHTNERTHAIIRAALDRSPLYNGNIEGPGPRYCPSVEDKVVRFADRTAHQIFIEPEGLTTREVYPNGISTSKPVNVAVARSR